MSDRELTEADRARYVGALAAFDAGDYFACHELLEHLWLRNRSPARPFFQGLIQLAGAYLLAERDRPRGARALFRESAKRLGPFAPGMLGLDVAHLLLETEAIQAHAEAMGPDPWIALVRSRRLRLRHETPTLEDFWPHRGVAPLPRAWAPCAEPVPS